MIVGRKREQELLSSLFRMDRSSVTPFGILHNSYSETVQSEVTAEDLFDL